MPITGPDAEALPMPPPAVWPAGPVRAETGFPAPLPARHRAAFPEPGCAPLLVTERLRLREFIAADARALAFYLSDPAVYRPLAPGAFAYTLADAEAWIAACRAHPPGTGSALRLAVERRAAPGLIGAVELARGVGGGELGFWIGRRFWGCGYATETVAAVLACGAAVLDMRCVTAAVLGSNPGSARVLEKCGFRRAGSRHRRRGVSIAVYEWSAGRSPAPIAAPRP